MEERSVAINARISAPAAARLRQLAARQGKSYGEVLTGLLLAVPVERASWEQPLSEAMNRITELEARLAALEQPTAPQQGEGLPTYYSGEKGVHSAAEGHVAADRIDVRGQGEGRPVRDADLHLHPVPSVPTPARSIRDVIAELAQQGLGPQAIATELNQRGYRTSNNTAIQRGFVNNTLKRLGV